MEDEKIELTKKQYEKITQNNNIAVCILGFIVAVQMIAIIYLFYLIMPIESQIDTLNKWKLEQEGQTIIETTIEYIPE